MKLCQLWIAIHCHFENASDERRKQKVILMKINMTLSQNYFLDDHIFDAITKLQSNKRQPNVCSVHNHILKTVESLTAKQIERLNDLIKAIASKINQIAGKTHTLF